jgi:hypothetical protein
MKNNDYKLYALLIAFLVTQYFEIRSVKGHIEKHSVHPQYGNYTKVNFETEKKTCDPWDSCE